MDCFSKNDLLLKIFNIPNVEDFRRAREYCKELGSGELLGFEGGKMIFKSHIVDNSVKTCEETSIDSKNAKNVSKTETNAEQAQQSKQTTVEEESPIKCENTSDKANTAEKQEVNINKIVLGPTGKKFLFLNGQKLQIIKHAPNAIPSNVNSAVKRLPTIFPKLVPPNSRPDSKTINVQTKRTTPVMYIESTPQRINITSKPPENISNKFSGKVISIKKGSYPIKLSNIMREVGGTIRVVTSVSSTNQGIPLIKDIRSSNPGSTSSEKLPIITGPIPGKMESSQCSCKNKHNSISVSTNTEQVETLDKQVQTDQVLQNNQVNSNDQSASALGELFSNNVIIGDDVNMGHGPPGIFVENERRMKIKFFQDLQSCVKWDSGKLPIHKAVIDQNIQAVKSQCVILKIRKLGVNIADSNSYTPLQLAVMNDVEVEIVKILLDYGADMSVLDQEGNNILHLAVEHNRNDLVNMFLKNLEGSNMDIDHFNYEGVTPLMMCTLLNDRIDMAEQLLKNNAKLNLKDRKSGRTAIFHAAVNHNAPMVLLLLDYGADTKIRNFFGTSVHDAMFELDDIPNEIKYPILGRDLKINEKRKLNQQDKGKQDINKPEKRPDNSFKRKKLEIVSTYQKLESKIILNPGKFK